MNLLAVLEKKIKPVASFGIGFALICVIGIVDLITGYEFGFSVFYVLPIALVTWLSNQRLGLITAILSVLVWVAADVANGHVYSNSFIPVWNSLIRVIFFAIITLLLSALKNAIQRESELARIDYLTGAINSRYFYELAQIETDRFQRYRHPFTLIYIDLDNFKTVNDRFGHNTGDEVLRKVVGSIRKNIRKTDTIARLGGDEFVLFFPETDQEAARVALSTIQNHLLDDMKSEDWPITFSIGVLTCKTKAPATDALVKMADDLMYLAKHEGKNAVRYAIH